MAATGDKFNKSLKNVALPSGTAERPADDHIFEDLLMHHTYAELDPSKMVEC